MEVNCWGAGSEGAGHARARVGMIGQGYVEAEEAGKKVRPGNAGPWVGVSPSDGWDVGVRVMMSTGLKAEVGVL